MFLSHVLQLDIMEKVANRRRLVVWVIMMINLSLFLSACSDGTPARKLLKHTDSSNTHVRLQLSDSLVVIDNELVEVTIQNPTGHLIGLKYKEMQNVLESRNHNHNKGYWDIVWDEDAYDKLETEHVDVITQTDDLVELSFTKKWNHGKTLPLNIQKRFIVRRGIPGVYMYGVFDREEDFPGAQMYQIRIAFKLKEDKFRFVAVSDMIQRIMPRSEDRDEHRSKTLDFKEAVVLTNPSNPSLKGEVDDKYQYSTENKDNKLHGWISDDDGVGFWIITPSNEFRTGGPHKQDLTSHVGPTALSMFVSTHYTGTEIDTFYKQGEAWKKVFGPVLIYLNSAPSNDDHRNILWNDAKRQLSDEIESWPYNFTGSEDFPHSEQRGQVNGQLLVQDRYMVRPLMQAKSAFVGLAAHGDAGSWQTEGKGYQFWTQTDNIGHFSIKNVRPGNYSFYAWVPGFIGDYKLDLNIIIHPGNKIELGTLIYDPPRNGPTLWEIGVPDRSAAEFFIPEPYPQFMNSITKDDTDKFRQYGLWDRYSDIYREGDLVYTVGTSNYSRDWFFAHVPRKTGNNTNRPTTWQIKYNLQDVNENGTYTLQLALAAASFAEVQVRFNDPNAVRPYFTTKRIGNDNAVARHGIHGLLPIKDRLHRMGVPTYGLCVNCNLYQETRDHLFFNCSMALNLKGKVLTTILKISWNAFIYYLWHERNQRIFRGRFRAVDAILKDVIDTVGIRLRDKAINKLDIINFNLCNA
ncbi:Cinnamyl alcohol dehydrogenase 6 [Hibiscus syriacus]|uniref:rhamnogalacturonan endolyase n=1 Tax=Hibiscus syriacus TaxID=106335 RepID=A0A6A2WP93_HIBSY|nr:Cinnamyl alcohol dehydrogenase 6 [Hibiscus syriacus]